MDSIDEQRAVDIALNVAREAYDEIEGYDISIEETGGEWRIDFRLPGSLERGGRSHFAVWVDKNSGEARLFRGR